MAISRGRPINDKNRFLNRIGYSTLVRKGLPLGTMARRCFVGLSSTRRRPGARSFGALRLLFTGKMIDGLGAPSSLAQRLPQKASDQKGNRRPQGQSPRAVDFFRSFLPRTTQGPRETLFLCHRRSDRKRPRIPHPDVARQIRKNPDLVIQVKASAQVSIKSSTPRSQMQNVMLFQHPANAFASVTSGEP